MADADQHVTVPDQKVDLFGQYWVEIGHATDTPVRFSVLLVETHPGFSHDATLIPTRSTMSFKMQTTVDSNMYPSGISAVSPQYQQCLNDVSTRRPLVMMLY